MSRFRLAHLCAAAALLGAACGGPDADARALAAAAGSAFEAAPFVLGAAVLARHARGRFAAFARMRALTGLAGCGCAHGRVPGALALPALALAWIAFGPAVAAARAIAGLGLAATRRPPADATALEDDDALYALERVAACAFVASLAVAACASAASHLAWPVLFFAGLAIGAIAPCATAGIAIASAFASVAPAAAAGVLCTAGLVNAVPRPHAAGVRANPARAALAVLAVTLCALALHGPSGLVNPRLLAAVTVASLLALAAAYLGPATTRSSLPFAVPAVMLVALVRPAHVSVPRADGTRLDAAFAGERLDFTGVAHRTGTQTTLSRLAITCCRLDASTIAVRLDRALAARDGEWVGASGTLVPTALGTLVLHADRVRAVAPPADPFVYR